MFPFTENARHSLGTIKYNKLQSERSDKTHRFAKSSKMKFETLLFFSLTCVVCYFYREYTPS